MGNTLKYLSYKYAFSQMRLAVDAGFFLEAVMIAESVISDRLHSACEGSEDGVHERAGDPKFINLHTLIKRAAKARMDAALVKKLNEWRLNRNRVAHAVARSRPGAPTMPVEEFRTLSKRTAEEGIALANEVKKWQRRTKQDIDLGK